MILRPVSPVSPCGPPTTKRPVGLIRNRVLLVQHLRRQDLADDFPDDEILDFLVLDVGGVLGGNDHIDDPHRPAVLILDGNLGLGVGPQPGDPAALAHAVQLPAQPVGEHDRRRHQLRRLVAGVAEHQTLVPRPLLRRLLALRRPRVHALGDVRALAGDQIGDEHLVGVKHIVVMDVADARGWPRAPVH